ncbi:hypothetical protein QE152_g32129 [Popillia japonica]|uniref:Uncharacterized protein n=1 Tax=Popillia japonica TaxID=7064 RepID=A0AAW1J015_POPJA
MIFRFCKCSKNYLSEKKLNQNGEKLIKCLGYTKDLEEILYKEDLDPKVEFKTISIKRRGFRKSTVITPFPHLKSPNPITTDQNGEKLIKCLGYTKDLEEILYKEDLDPKVEFQTISIKRRGFRKSTVITPFPHLKSPNPITTEKKKNLLELSPYINIFHDFYKNLISAECKIRC